MFGYVTVCKEYMTEEDYERFKAYYCGLCHATGKQCSTLARLGLSYDITFLAIVLSAVTKGEAEHNIGVCAAHPLKRHKYVVNDRAVDYAACMGVILTYLKFLDDWRDVHSIKAVFGMLMFYRGMKKAKKRYLMQYESIDRELKRLSVCEKNNAGIDEAADCFAKILEILFTPDFITDTTERKVLGWFGYNIGRWIYVIDAYSDIDEDLKHKCYNPFSSEAKDRERLKKRLNTTLTLNLDTAASAYELLRVHKNDGIIRHIVYTSLYLRQNKILGEANESI